jgi:non-specific protein-tyrosine kinase
MSNDTREPELRDYLSVLRRRKWIIALTVVGVLVAAMGVALLQTPKYAATARVLLQPRSTDNLFNPETGQATDPSRSVQTEIQVIESKPVQDEVRSRFGSVARVVASPIGQTNVIAIKAVSTERGRAAAVANAYANAYVNVRRSQTVDDLLAAVAQIQSKITDLDHQIAATEPADRQKRDSLEAQQTAFKAKLNETQVASALQTGGVRLVNPAETPSSPFSPTPKRDAVLALFIGLILGAAVAFAVEYFDDSINSNADLERAVGGRLPTRGVIPSTAGWHHKDRPDVVSAREPTSPASEAFRSLRTNLQYMHIDKPLRVMQVTSPSEGEGKTTTLANLGVAFASTGQRVCVVDSDLRRPSLHEFFGLDNSVGFTSVMFGERGLSDALQPAPNLPNLYVLASGPLRPYPAELLGSDRASVVIDSLRTMFDLVLLDCPPVLPVTDAAALSRRADATLLVAMAGNTRKHEIARAVQLLEQVDAPLAGIVLNGLDEVGGYRHYRYEAYAPSTNGSHRAPSEVTL